MTTDRSHAEYSPSRLSMLAKCLGWIGDGQPGSLAARGTAIGERLAGYMTDGIDPLDGADPDDRAAIENGMAALDQIRERHPELVWTAERWVDTGIEGCSGYCDLDGTDPLGIETPVLIEIKTGRGEREPAQTNMQVAAYALGLARVADCSEVIAYMIECDTGAVSAAVLRPDRVPIAELIARAKAATDADLTPGSQCAYCARREQCPPVVASPDNALAMIGERTLSPKDYAGALSPADLGETLERVLPVVKLADDYASALKSRAMAIIEAGGEVPGWTVKHSGGNRAWIDMAAARAELEAKYPEDWMSLIELCSPAQAEKRLPRGAKAAIAPLVLQAEKRSLVAV